ncbi:MAG: 30S ribosomal protein S2, partial [Candidatus Hodgkinia cicadicola]
MALNNNSVTTFPFPRDIDTFIAFNVHFSKKPIETNLVQSPTVMSLLKDWSVLDANKTLSSLRLALAVIYNLISRGEKILFVRSKTLNCEIVNKFVS